MSGAGRDEVYRVVKAADPAMYRRVVQSATIIALNHDFSVHVAAEVEAAMMGLVYLTHLGSA